MAASGEPTAAAVACQETLLNAQDAVGATMMQLSQWGLTNEAAPLAPRALALLRRKQRGRDGTGVDKLFEAAKGGRGALSVHELAIALTKTGPESRGWSSQTALHVAARSNFVEGVKLLLAHGFDIEAVDGRGLTPVRVAARHGAAAAAAALIDAGAEAERASATTNRRNAVSHAVSLSRRALVVDDVGSAMKIALESVPKQPRCLEVAEVLAQKGCTVPPTLASTALLLAVQNELPHLRKAADMAVEWRGDLPMIVHALECHERWDSGELRRWLEQHSGNRIESDASLISRDSVDELRMQVKLKCQQSLQQLLGPENPTSPLMTPVRNSASDSSMGFDMFMHIPEKQSHGHRYVGQSLVRRSEGFVASPIFSDNIQRRLHDKAKAVQRQVVKATAQERQTDDQSMGQHLEDNHASAALSDAIDAPKPEKKPTRQHLEGNHASAAALSDAIDASKPEKNPEVARAKRQRVIKYVAAVEAEEAEALAAAKSAATRLLDLYKAAKAIWSPPPLPANVLTGETPSKVWEAHDGPAPVRYAIEAAAVAACRGAAARHRVLEGMVLAMEQEVRERHWAATGLTGPMLRTGIYADYRELISQSAQDDAWIARFDAKWKKRARAAEQAAKAAAALDVQLIPNSDTFEKVVREMNSLHKAEVCPWEIDMRELAGGFARVITRPPTPPQKDATSGKDKYVEVILHEDGRKMRLPELAIRLIPVEYQTENALRDVKPFLKTGWEYTASLSEQNHHPTPDHMHPQGDPEGWEDELERETKREHDRKVANVIQVLKPASGSGEGGKGWKILRRTVKEETATGKNWREWERETDYDGYDAVKVKNVHGVMVGLEGGWDGRELGLGGGTKEQLEAARKWKQQAVEKRRVKPTNSFFGNRIGSFQETQPPSPDSPAIILNKWAQKAAEEGRMAAAAAKQQATIDSWGGAPPNLDELSAVAQLRKDKSNRQKKRGKGIKGSGAPPGGMFIVQSGIKTTTGPHDPSDMEGDAEGLGWLSPGDVIAIMQMEGLTSGAVVGKIEGVNRGWVVVLDQCGKTNLTRIPKPTALDRARYEVEKDELTEMQARLAKSDAGAGAVRLQAIADAGVKSHALRERIAELETKIQASSALGRSRARYKRELSELDHELARIEADKRAMENGGATRRMLVEEISYQEEVVNALRVRVEAEDKLIELEALAKYDRKRARREEQMREAEKARQRDEAKLNLAKQRQARGVTTASLNKAVEGMPHKRRGAVVGSDAFTFTDDARGDSPPVSNLRRRDAVTGLLPLTIPSNAGSPVGTSAQSPHSSAFSQLELGGGALSADAMEAALRVARSYTPDRFDEILIRELGKRSKQLAEDAARAENDAQMERFRMQNRLTHELAHEGLPRDVRRWDTSASRRWLAAIGLRGAQVSAVVQMHGLDGEGLLFSDPAVLGRLFRPAWLSAGVPELRIDTRVKALSNALDYLRTEVAGLPPWTAKVELAQQKELDEWGRVKK